MKHGTTLRPVNHPTSVANELNRDLKAAAESLQELMQRVELHVEEQHQHAIAAKDVEEMQRLDSAKPFDWHAQAKHSLQAGIMFAVRAVEQPESF